MIINIMTNYHIMYRNIPPERIARVFCAVQDSSILEMDDEGLGHIVTKSTGERVGYIGDDTLQLCDTHNKSLKRYHSYAKRIFKKTIENLKNPRASPGPSTENAVSTSPSSF